MLEPLGVALHSHDLGKPSVGAIVAVVGCEPIGLCVIQLARIAGARTIVAAEAHGAGVSLDPSRPDILEALLRATGAAGADVAFEVAGTDDAVGIAIHAAKPGGRVILAGIPGDDSTTFPASIARRKGLTLKLVRRMKEMYPRTIRLVDDGRVDVTSIVSHTFGLDRADEAFRLASERIGLKIIVAPGA